MIIITDYLYFGIESNNLNDIEKIACAIDSDEYEKTIKLLVNESNESFPTLREKALKSLGIDVSNTSNDMLAVEYIRAIKNNSLNLKYRAIKRVGAGYNDDTVCDLMSASAIRKQFYDYVCAKAYEIAIQDKQTILLLNTRKMFCLNKDCSHKTFSERFDFISSNGK